MRLVSQELKRVENGFVVFNWCLPGGAKATEFWRVYHAFRRHHLRCSPLALQRLHELLYAYGNASATGIINKKRRWDFPGSFHFVGTIVSTIGKIRNTGY